MNELIYARPVPNHPGEIEIIVSRGHEVIICQHLDQYTFAALFDAFTDAARERLVRRLPRPREARSEGLEANRRPDRNTSRYLRDLDYKDKSRRKYGVAPTAIDGYGYYV